MAPEAVHRASSGAEPQGRHPQRCIQPYLGHDGEQRSHRRRRARIGFRQPKIQRQQRGLAAEHQQQQAQRGFGQRHILRRQIGDALRKLGHVERAEHTEQQAQRNQEQRRRAHVEHHVMQAYPHLQSTPAAEQQAIGGDQHDLEEHEQVEDVPGQERTVQAHQLELEQRMKMRCTPVPACARMQQARRAQDQGRQQHPRRQAVAHQRDTDARRPVAEQIHQDFAVGRACEQGDDRRGQQGHADPRHVALHARPIATVLDEQRRRRAQHRDQDRQDQQMVHRRASRVSMPVVASSCAST